MSRHYDSRGVSILQRWKVTERKASDGRFDNQRVASPFTSVDDDPREWLHSRNSAAVSVFGYLSPRGLPRWATAEPIRIQFAPIRSHYHCRTFGRLSLAPRRGSLAANFSYAHIAWVSCAYARTLTFHVYEDYSRENERYTWREEEEEKRSERAREKERGRERERERTRARLHHTSHVEVAYLHTSAEEAPTLSYQYRQTR